MNPTNLQDWVEHPDLLNRETLYELRNLLARYPYFQTVRLLYLKNLYLLHDIGFGPELRAAALYITDRTILFKRIEGHKYVIEAVAAASSVDAQEAGLDRTLTLIDAFLSSLPKEQTQPVPFDLPNDYSAYLLEENRCESEKAVEEAPRLRGQDLIDGFIEKAEREPAFCSSTIHSEEPEPALSGLPEEEDEEDESCFTETLAKIYIKQKRYEKALEIIKKLSLKYPKKNAYFADQIRFLEKLIINTKSK